MKESFHELTDCQWQIIEKIINDQRQRWPPYELWSMVLYLSIAQGHNGVNWIVNTRLGKVYIIILASSKYEVFGKSCSGVWPSKNELARKEKRRQVG